MSQLYHVQLKTSVSRQIDASDSVSYPIELTEILPQEDMLERFKQALLEHGWEEQADGSMTRTGSAGESLVIDLENKTLTASLGDSKQVTTEVSVDETIDAWDKSDADEYGRQMLNDKVQQVEGELKGEERNLQNELTRQLIESEQDRMRLLNEVLQDVYSDALKTKAGQLGEVTSVNESTNANGEYELVIKVTQ